MHDAAPDSRLNPLIPPACAIVFVLAIGAVFWPVVSSTKIWDDDVSIFRNPLMIAPPSRALADVWLRPHMDLYIPLTRTIWWGMAQLAHQTDATGPSIDPKPFHVANLVLHLAASGAVFVLLRRLLRHDAAALIGALLFALHPVQVETVGWISGMKDVLCGLLCVVALDQYLVAVSRASPSQSDSIMQPSRNNLRYGLALGSALVAMLSKPTAVVLPLMILLLDASVLRRPWRQIMRDAWPFFALAVPCAIWTIQLQPAPTVVPVAVHLRPLVAADAVAYYLYKIFVPVRLGLDYGRTPAVVMQSPWIWWSWSVVAATIAIAWLARRRMPLFAAGIAIFLIALLPVLGLKHFDFQTYSTVADHYLYLPMVGLSLAATSLLPRSRQGIWAFAILVLLGLTVLTALQARHWRSTRHIFERTLAVNPRSWAASIYLADIALNENRFSDVETIAQNALKYDPPRGEHTFRLLLGQAYERLRKIEDAIQQLQRVVALEPNQAQTRALLASVYLQSGNMQAGVEQVHKALELDPANPWALQLQRQINAVRGAREMRAPPSSSPAQP